MHYTQYNILNRRLFAGLQHRNNAQQQQAHVGEYSTTWQTVTIDLLSICKGHFLGVDLLLLLLHSLAAHSFYLPQPLPLDHTIV